MRFLDSEWSQKMDASNEGAANVDGGVNPVLDCEISPRPSPPRKTRQTRQIGLNLLITLIKLMSGCSKKSDKSSRCHFSRCGDLF